MTQYGYWRNFQTENRRVTLNDYGVINKVWYLFPQGDGPRGSFSTFTDLKPHLRSRDLIYLSGVLREQVTTPVGIFDVTILGAANKPRQATNGGVPTGGGASWLAPTSPVATTPLISVIEQGWEFNNIQMAPVANAPCIWLRRQESLAIPDGSHTKVISCFFSAGGSGGIGIGLGETARNLIQDCDFEGLGTGVGYVTDGGFAVNQYNQIIGNRFRRGTTYDIKFPGTYALIKDNVFHSKFAVEAGARIDLTGGSLNMVIENYVADVDTTINLGFMKGDNGDVWRNYVATVADPKVVVPA
jgi:hypothetical protein